MSEERYNRSKGQWETGSKESPFDMADAIYEEVGTKFRIDWVDGQPIIDFNDLPDGVSEQDVKDAVKNNVPSG